MPDASVSLKVNGRAIELDGFARSFISSTVLGMLSPLRGMADLEDLESVKLDICGRDVSVVANGAEIEITRFTRDFIRNTMTGMVSPLRGVDTMVDTLELTLLMPLTN